MTIVTLETVSRRFAMEVHYILWLILLGSSFSEWVLLPSISPKQDKLKSQFTYKYEFKSPSKNFYVEECPDFHNLTTMSYGTLYNEDNQSRSGWEISMEDVEEILKENEKLPKTSKEKANLVKALGETMEIEAEQQLMALFAPARVARTKYFQKHSMESALMTISLLLFGVYLSKLILKLLVSHYNRFNGGITMMTGIRAPITLAHGRKKRSAALLQEINLMYIIDKYNTRFN